MQPGNTSPGGAEPDGPVTDAAQHGLADCLPEGMSLIFRGVSDEGREVAVCRWLREGTRYNQDRISAEVWEDHDASCLAKLLGEGLRIRTRCQAGAVQQDALEWLAEGGSGDGGRFPAEGGVGGVGQEIVKGGSEAGVGLPGVEDFRVGRRTGVAVERAVEAAGIGQVLSTKGPRFVAFHFTHTPLFAE